MFDENAPRSRTYLFARRSVSALLFAGALASAGTAAAAVTWRADFETGSISQFMGNVNAMKGTRRNIEIVTDPVQQGMSAGKFTIHEDDTFAGTQMRVQVTRSGSPTGEGADVFMSFYFQVMADPMVRANIAYWETTGSNRNMMTWWLAPKAGGGTLLNFGTGNLGSTKQLLNMEVAVGKWHQIAYHVHWSTNAQTGNIEMWLDGTQVVNEKAMTKPDGNSLFFQAGIHRASRSPLIDTVFFDNFLEGTSVADLALATPVPGTDGGASADAAAPADAGADSSSAGTGGSSGSGGISGSGGSGGSGTGGSSGSGGSSGGSGGSGGTTIPGTGTGGQAGAGVPVEGGASICSVGTGGAPTTPLAALTLLLGAVALSRRRGPRR